MDVTPSQPSNDEKTKPSDSETKKGKAKDNKRKDAPKKEVKGETIFMHYILLLEVRNQNKLKA